MLELLLLLLVSCSCFHFLFSETFRTTQVGRTQELTQKIWMLDGQVVKIWTVV